MNAPCKIINNKVLTASFALKLLTKFNYVLYWREDNSYWKMLRGELHAYFPHSKEWEKIPDSIRDLVSHGTWNMAREKAHFRRERKVATLLTGKEVGRALNDGKVLQKRNTELLFKRQGIYSFLYRNDFKMWQLVTEEIDYNCYYKVVEDPIGNNTFVEAEEKRKSIVDQRIENFQKMVTIYNQNRKLTVSDFDKTWVYRDKPTMIIGKINILYEYGKARIDFAGKLFTEKEFFSSCSTLEEKDLNIFVMDRLCK